ncbi:MAG: PAS domain S-box-containing protein [Chlamydiales bacterium]|jgi:PAS domain S-box-containing protein
MASTGLSLLQKVAKSVSESTTKEEGIENLTKAFNLFSQETTRLEAAYENLRAKLHTVNLELEESNRRLNQNFVELDSVTNYLDGILSHMQQGILFMGLSGDVTTFNAAAEEILGYKREKVLFSQFWDHFDDKIFGFSMGKAIEEKLSDKSFFTALSNEYGSKDVEVTLTFVGQGPELNHGLIVMLRDVTEVFRLQRLATRNNRLEELGEMAASVAHEIRNPLGGIEGFASLLCRDLVDRPESQNMASQIVEGTRALNNLVSRVLDYSRPIDMYYEQIDLVSFVEKNKKFILMDHSFPKNVSLVLESECESLEAHVDPNLINSVLYNLIFNAAQALPEGGRVVISLEDEGQNFVLKVADTGVGISAENLEKIFSPFFTTKHNGNGFGLSEVYKVVQAHDGTIEVNSELDQGTAFVIRIPKAVKRPEGGCAWQ